MKALGYIYLGLAAATFLLGFAQCIHWGDSNGLSGLWYLLHFVPAWTFLVAYSANRKGARIAAVLLGVLAIGFVWFVAVVIDGWISAASEVTNVGRYDEILSNYWKPNEELVQHFPHPIPSDVKDVRFSFAPAFLQGGAHIQLRYAAPPAAISELHERFVGKKTASFTGGDTNVHMNTEVGMPTTFFYTGESGNGRFPDDYEIMIFDKVLEREDRSPGFYWNHGKSHGVAISKKRNEIIYWAELW
jgi:hypothetical protein